LHIIEETLTFIRSEFKHVNNVGLLATTGSIYGGLFQNLSTKFGVNIIIPTEHDQNLLMEAIYGKNGIKAGITTGEPRETVIRIADSLIKCGAETIVGGCTEIPLVINNNDLPVPFIDTLEVLAKATVIKATSDT
jgi:aspartate racemase